MDRVKTGIIGLDKHIEGGYPKNASIVLIGPPGCGKSTIAQQFVVEGLKNRQPVIYVAFDSSPEEPERGACKERGLRLPFHAAALRRPDPCDKVHPRHYSKDQDSWIQSCHDS